MSVLYFKTPIGQHGKHILPKNLKHSWTKWNRDINLGLETRTPEWICQICGEKQVEVLDPFVFPISDREYLRICSKCENKRITFDIHTFEVLILICKG